MLGEGCAPGGGTLLKAGWQEAGRPWGHLARRGVRLLGEAASKAMRPASSGQKNAKASSQAPGPRTHAHTAQGGGPRSPCRHPGRVGREPLSCATGEQAVSPGGGHGLGLLPRAVEPLEEGCQIQPLKAPRANGDQGMGVGRGAGPVGRQRGQSGQLVVLGKGRRGPSEESVPSHPSPTQGCPGACHS